MANDMISRIPTLTIRQTDIVDLVRENGDLSNKEILAQRPNITRATLSRDLKKLVACGILEPVGRGRGVRYHERVGTDLLRFINVDRYFAQGPDERVNIKERFDFGIFDTLHDIFTHDELGEMDALNKHYRERIARIPGETLEKEFERLTIDLSWKSSHIEGNTYSLIDTEVLIKEHREAKGHTKQEALMILNHKRALEFIRDNQAEFKNFTVQKLESVHDLIISDMGIARGLRTSPVGIVGTRYRPLDNVHQIREALEKTGVVINNGALDPFSKTLVAIAMISCIQPFSDGNKRTARMLGDALLMAHDTCPLSFRSVEPAEYKKALVLFYEQSNLRAFKDIFIEQFHFATSHYFLG